MSVLSDKLAALKASVAALDARVKSSIESGVSNPADLADLDAIKSSIDSIDPAAPPVPAPAPDAPAA